MANALFSYFSHVDKEFDLAIPRSIDVAIYYLCCMQGLVLNVHYCMLSLESLLMYTLTQAFILWNMHSLNPVWISSDIPSCPQWNKLPIANIASIHDQVYPAIC